MSVCGTKWCKAKEQESRARIATLEDENARLKSQLEYATVTPASAVAPEITVTRENNEALGLKVAELEAQCAAMREALDLAEECFRRHDRAHPDCGTAFPGIADRCRAALATDAGREVLNRLNLAEETGPKGPWMPEDECTQNVAKARAETIERCAKVAWVYARNLRNGSLPLQEFPDIIASAIRALAKESP